ncbi:helix-turn-helix domain-containing protein [Haliangium sp.]|uniref:helix-turn-helix domain-containing protein n=1 Tax=Haliangium sp. TaxID=2663208 RepID=UPI003D0BD3FB
MSPVAPADWAIPEPTCSLDVADLVQAGETAPSLGVVGRWFGVTYERVRQLESGARLKAGWLLREVDRDLPEVPEQRPTSPPDSRRNEDAIVAALRAHRGWLGVNTLARRIGITERGIRDVITRLRQRGAPIESRRSYGGGYRWAV